MSRGVEPSVKASVEKNNVDKCSCREGVGGTKQRPKNRSSIDPPAIEDPETFSIDPPSYRGSIKIVIRKSLRARQITRCRGGVEIT